jgi:hypothetical protein
MRFHFPSLAGIAATMCCVAGFSPALAAQNSIQLFAPVDVRASAAGTGYGASTVIFNSTTLHLNCPASPVATLSSTGDNTGKLLVDNDIAVTVMSGGTTTGPTNICVGGANNSSIGIPFQNCFALALENAPLGSVLGQDPDNFVASYGVPAIDISSKLVPGDLQLKIDLQDEGGYLSNSTLYLNTSCTQTGVTGPALISGNPIPTNNPTTNQLAQDFSFDGTNGQQIGFEYDLTGAQSAGSVNIADQTIPEVGDMPLDPALFKSAYTPGTSFSTSSCFIHTGELLANSQPACKLYTLECKVGTGATASGAQCPVSTIPNEVFNDVFDGPAFTLPDIPTPSGTTFHTGVGLLMAKEGWIGGPCTFDLAANLPDLDCPQNLLTSFSSTSASAQSLQAIHPASKLAKSNPQANIKLATSPRALLTTTTSGTYTSTGRTTHPNSTFVSVAGVPEPLTMVTIQSAYQGSISPDSGGQYAISWVKGNPVVNFSTQPPNLAGTNLPGAATFLPSPIANINYAVGLYQFPTNQFPPLSPGDPSAYPFEFKLTNPQGCPAPSNPTSPAASVFNPAKQTISGWSEGTYLLYYYAQDCAGTEELQFAQNNNGNWSSNFYAVPFGIDNTAPVIKAQFPPGNTGGIYQIGDQESVPFSCTDAGSGVASCDIGTNPTPGSNGGVAVLDTTSPGTKTLILTSLDHVGNKSTVSFPYSVQFPQQTNSVQLSLSGGTLTYPGSINATVKVGPSSQNPPGAPVGTVQVILDGQTLVAQGSLSPSGHGFSSAYAHIANLPAGQHTLTAVNPGGISNVDHGLPGSSIPVSILVQPGPVTLSTSCVNPALPFGANFSCNVYTKPIAAGAPGVATYRYDNSAPVTLTLSGGTAAFSITKPAVGPHSVVISYAAQGNYAAATPQTLNFTVLATH